MKEGTKGWVSKARSDLASAELLLDNHLFDTSCYHSQQAAEKYLKALLCELDQPVPKLHDLEKLVFLIKDAGADLTNRILDDCMALSGMDTLVRYQVTTPVKKMLRMH